MRVRTWQSRGTGKGRIRGGAIAAALLVGVAIALSLNSMGADGPRVGPLQRFLRSAPSKRMAARSRTAPDEPVSQPAEAPTGFNNSTNGLVSQADFDADRKTFEEVDTILPETEDNGEESGGGLGPVYNSTSCVACHQNPVTGSSSQISELRAGMKIDGKFVEPLGGSLIHQRTIDAAAQERVLPEFNVRTLRMSTTTLGDGFVEVIPDSVILDVLNSEPTDLKGYAVPVPVVVSGTINADGSFTFNLVERLGRFGWKCQEASLINFAAGAYINEIGITNPLNPKENKSNGRDVSQFDQVLDPEDKVDKHKDRPFGDDVNAFAEFMRATKAPPRDFSLANTDDVKAGELLFNDTTTGAKKLGCAVCHHPCYTTPPAGTPIVVTGTKQPASDLPGSVVPAALGNKMIHPYSDFLLHDIGTGDGIAQTQHAQRPPRGVDNLKRAEYPTGEQAHILRVGRTPRRKAAATSDSKKEGGSDQCPPVISEEELDQNTADKIRTAPLWGLRVRPQLLHDGTALTIEDAIIRHIVNQAGPGPSNVQLPGNYQALTNDQKRQLKAFLNSL